MMAEGEKQSAFKRVSTYVWVVGVVLLAVVIFALVGIMRALFSTPEARVDYIAQANELSKPADYDANMNAAFDYEKAFEIVTDAPKKLRLLWCEIWPEDMNDVEREAMEKWVKEKTEAMEHLQRGSTKPYCWFEYGGDSMKDAVLIANLSELKSSAYCMLASARLKAANGDARGGLEDVMTIYRMGRHLCGKKTLVEQLVGIAIKSLAIKGATEICARGHVDGQMVGWLASELERNGVGEGKSLNIAIEKVLFLDTVQMLYGSGFFGDRIMSVKAAKKYGVPWELASREETVAAYEQVCDYWEECRRKKPYELRLEGKDFETKTPFNEGGNKLALVLLPALGRVSELCWREWVNADALVTVVGLLRYKKEKGKYPESLKELVAGGYIKAVPADPYGEGSLGYIKDRGDFVLYSCGPDFRNDWGVRGKRAWDEDEGDRVFWPVEGEE